MMKRAIVIAVLAACSKPAKDPNALTDAEVAKVKEELAKATAEVTARKQSLAKAFTSDAMIDASSKSQVTDKPCPRKLELPDDATMTNYVQKGGTFIELTYEVVSGGKAPVGKNLERYEKTAAEVAELVAKGKATKQDAERLRTGAANVTEEWVVDGFQKRGLPMGAAFESGNLYGTAYVFSYEQGKIICAGKLDAKNTEHLEFEYMASNENWGEKLLEAQKGILARDLEVNIAKAFATNLRSAEL